MCDNIYMVPLPSEFYGPKASQYGIPRLHDLGDKPLANLKRA